MGIIPPVSKRRRRSVHALLFGEGERKQVTSERKGLSFPALEGARNKATGRCGLKGRVKGKGKGGVLKGGGGESVWRLCQTKKREEEGYIPNTLLASM